MSLEWLLLSLRLLAAIILYTFLGLAFYLIWRDLKHSERQNSLQTRLLTDQLRVVATEKEPPIGHRFSLHSITLLGTDKANRILVGDVPISNSQARLSRENDVWWLESLGSHHNIKLNNVALTKPMPLTYGDVIEMDRVSLVLESANQ